MKNANFVCIVIFFILWSALVPASSPSYMNRDNESSHVRAAIPPAKLAQPPYASPEWNSGTLPGHPGTLVNDTNGDGRLELVVWYSDLSAYGGRVIIYDGTTRQPLWDHSFTEAVGYVVADDIDADGTKELLVWTYKTAATQGQYHGFIYIFDGKTYAQEWQSPDFYPQIPSFIAVNDTDKDGIKEIISSGYYWSYTTALYYYSNAYVFDGATHAQDWKSPTYNGILYGTVEDVDDDTVREIILWYSDSVSKSGVIRIFDGVTHTEEWMKSITEENIASAVIADVDGDSTKEIVFSGWSATATSGIFNSYIYIYDGKTHTQEWKSSSFYPNRISYIIVNDVDSDSTKELVFSVYGWSISGSTVYYRGRVLIYSGNAHTQEWQSPEYDGMPGILVDDVDKDRTKELLIWYSNPTTSIGHLEVIAGTTHSSEWSTSFGESVTTVTVLDADYCGMNELFIWTWLSGVSTGAYHSFIYVFNTVTHVQKWKSSDFYPLCIYPCWNMPIVDLDGDVVKEIIFSGYEYIGNVWHGEVYIYAVSPSGLSQYSIALSRGWNLISIPFSTPSNSLATVLGSISGSYDEVRYYNASDTASHWKSWSSNRQQSMNNLNLLDRTMGVWIHMTKPGTLTGYGKKSATTLGLRAGWNLVGYPTDVSKTVSDAFSGLWGSKVTRVQSGNSSAYYNLVSLSDTSVLEPGHGYWVYCKADCSWTVNW